MLSKRLFDRMNSEAISQTELARRVGVSQQTIGKLVRGDALNSVHLHKIARELNTSVEYLTGETEQPGGFADTRLPFDNFSGQPSRFGEVMIREIDLNFGMGATYMDVPVTEKKHHVPLEFIRNFTASPAEKLYFAEGAGDSMYPTIADQDILLVDSGQQSVMMADKIWAVAFGDVGMIKRLRPMPDGSIKILSDNPQIPEDIAHDGELHILGRVVAVVRKF